MPSPIPDVAPVTSTALPATEMAAGVGFTAVTPAMAPPPARNSPDPKSLHGPAGTIRATGGTVPVVGRLTSASPAWA